MDFDKELAARAMFQRVLDAKNPDDVTFLAFLMDQAGYLSMNPETVKPELVALVNTILNQAGVVHPLNYFNFARAVLEIADEEDIHAAMRAEAQEE